MYDRVSSLSTLKRLLFVGVATGSLLVSVFVTPVFANAQAVPVLSSTSAQPKSSVQAISLTTADSGRTINVPKGTAISVYLSLSNYIWSVPQTSNSAVLWQTSGATLDGGSIATATFSAVSRGTATISAVASPSCALSQPACMLPAYGWNVTITVSQ